MREVAKLEKDKPEQFKRIYGPRSVIEAIPSSSKRQQRHCRLQRRFTDPTPSIADAADASESALTSRPQEELRDIVRAQEDAVGIARLNEILAIHLIGNLRKIVMLEELLDQQARFVPGFAFEPLTTVWLDELDDAGAIAQGEGA